MPKHPGIGIDFFNQNAIYKGNDNRAKFVIQPNPFQSNCDPTLASSPHPGGIQVALADGSVRNLSAGTSAWTWWLALVPQRRPGAAVRLVGRPDAFELRITIVGSIGSCERHPDGTPIRMPLEPCFFRR
jgi:prepilin-type processing-associated H-X9-DG protein